MVLKLQIASSWLKQETQEAKECLRISEGEFLTLSTLPTFLKIRVQQICYVGRSSNLDFGTDRKGIHTGAANRLTAATGVLPGWQRISVRRWCWNRHNSVAKFMPGFHGDGLGDFKMFISVAQL